MQHYDPLERRASKRSSWPPSSDRNKVFLLDASSPFETRLLRSWIEQNYPAGVEASCIEVVDIPASRRPRRGQEASSTLREFLTTTTGDPLLAPLRVGWLAKERDGVRAARISDLFLGDPRDPGQVTLYR